MAREIMRGSVLILMGLSVACTQPLRPSAREQMTSGSVQCASDDECDDAGSPDEAAPDSEPMPMQPGREGKAPKPPEPGATEPGDACADNPCRHGSCKAMGDGFSCDCAGTGFGGVLCD